MSNAQRRAAERHAKRSLGPHPGAGQTWPGFGVVAEAGERFARLVQLDKELTAKEERERRALIVANGNPPVSGADRRRWKALRNAGHVASPMHGVTADLFIYDESSAIVSGSFDTCEQAFSQDGHNDH